MSPNLLGSADTLPGIYNLISRFYSGYTVALSNVSEIEWEISTEKGKREGMRVLYKNKRYRFEAVGD